jgi:hypothetical protein
MAKVGVSLKIDVSKIDKARLFKGQKGTYLDATVFIDLAELDQYDNSGMITQDVSKEEKNNNVKGAILGNCKVFWSDSGQMPQAQGMQTNNLNQPQHGGFQQNPNTPVSNANQQPATANGGNFGQAQQQPAPQPQYNQPINTTEQNNEEFGDSIPF